MDKEEIKKEIIEIINQIFKLEDKNEIIFPLLKKFKDIYNSEDEGIFHNIFVDDEDISKILMEKKGEDDLGLYIFKKVDSDEFKEYIKNVKQNRTD